MDVKAIRFYDTDLNFLKEVDDFETVIYRSKWNTYGYFEFYFSERMPCMKKDNIIIWDYDTRKNGIIKYINCTEEGTIIRGFSLLWLLTKRIALPPVGEDYDVLSGTYEDCIYAMVDHNVIHPVNEKRKLVLWECRESKSRGGTCRYQARHEKVMDVLIELSTASTLGIGTDIDLSRKKIIFEVLKGTDRTAQQKERPPVIFSDTRENVENREYTLNDEESSNCAYVAGQGEGAARTIVTVGDEYTGNDRQEVFIDARDVENASALSERGRSKLAGMLPAESYSSDVFDGGYRIKWDIGDFVTAIDEEYSVTLAKQILEVEENMDENGYVVIPTLGIPEKEVSEKISSGSTPESMTGGSDITYIHTQMVPSREWIIAHNLGKFPSVAITDSAGSMVIGETEYVNRDSVKLTFSSAFAGYAYLN